MQHARRPGWIRLRPPAALVAVAVMALGVTGCAGRSERRSLSAATVEGKAAFSPQTVTVHTGDEVDLTVSNDTDTTHGFDIEGYGMPPRTIDPTLPPEHVKFTARRAGNYKIFCHLHPTHQTATLVVL